MKTPNILKNYENAGYKVPIITMDYKYHYDTNNCRFIVFYDEIEDFIVFLAERITRLINNHIPGLGDEYIENTYLHVRKLVTESPIVLYHGVQCRYVEYP